MERPLSLALNNDPVVSAALGSNFVVSRDKSFVANYKEPPSKSKPATGSLDYALIIGVGGGVPAALVILCILYYLVRAASPNADLERYKREGPQPAMYAGKPPPHPVTKVGGVGRGRRDTSTFTSTNPMQVRRT